MKKFSCYYVKQEVEFLKISKIGQKSELIKVATCIDITMFEGYKKFQVLRCIMRSKNNFKIVFYFFDTFGVLNNMQGN